MTMTFVDDDDDDDDDDDNDDADGATEVQINFVSVTKLYHNHYQKI